MSRHRIENRAKAKRARTGGRRGRLADVGARVSRVSLWLGTGAVSFGVAASLAAPATLAYAAPPPPAHSDSADTNHPDGDAGSAGTNRPDGDSGGAGTNRPAGGSGPGTRHSDGDSGSAGTNRPNGDSGGAG